jgi:hypothetical protein
LQSWGISEKRSVWLYNQNTITIKCFAICYANKKGLQNLHLETLVCLAPPAGLFSNLFWEELKCYIKIDMSGYCKL